MKGERICLSRRIGTIKGMSLCATLLVVVSYVPEAASIEIPPAVEKKSVSLEKRYVEAGRIFTVECGKCHKAPEPVHPKPWKTDCTKSLSKEDLGKVQNYVTDVRAGKKLYELHCGRCHELIPPGLHTPEYWSKNLCTSDECFVKKLSNEDEQQVLLYLSAYAERN